MLRRLPAGNRVVGHHERDDPGRVLGRCALVGVRGLVDLGALDGPADRVVAEPAAARPVLVHLREHGAHHPDERLPAGEDLHDAAAALELAVGALLTLLLVSRGDSGFQWEAVVYPLPVAQRQLPELMVAELQVAECRSRDAESDCRVFLRNPRCDSFSPHFRPLPLDGCIVGMHDKAVRLTRYVAFDASSYLSIGKPFGPAPLDVFGRPRVRPHPVHRDDMKGLVGVPVATAIQLLMFTKNWSEWPSLLEHRGH